MVDGVSDVVRVALQRCGYIASYAVYFFFLSLSKPLCITSIILSFYPQVAWKGKLACAIFKDWNILPTPAPTFLFLL